MSDENSAPNGAEGYKQRVRFGDGPAQSVPLEWAEPMLRWLFDHHSLAFRDALTAAIGLHIPARGRPKVTP